MMTKADGAFLTIGELAGQLGVPQHILRYWETRFPQLKPLQRSGNRRYYRPEDVALVRRIHHLLNVEGFTVMGARKALAARGADEVPMPDTAVTSAEEAAPEEAAAPADLLPKLEAIRDRLARALGG